MDFSLSTEHEVLRDSVRNFAEKEIRPVARELDDKEEFSYETMQKMAELGLFGVFVSEKYGGQEMDYLSYIIATEEIARVDGSHAARDDGVAVRGGCGIGGGSPTLARGLGAGARDQPGEGQGRGDRDGEKAPGHWRIPPLVCSRARIVFQGWTPRPGRLHTCMMLVARVRTKVSASFPRETAAGAASG